MSKTESERLNEELQSLILKAQKNNISVAERNRTLDQLIRRIQSSGKLWRGGSESSNPLYLEALQDTWLFILQNLHNYDPARASVMTWVNLMLKFKLRDLQRKHYRQKQREWNSIDLSDEAKTFDIEYLPARVEIPPIIETVKEWVIKDPEGILKSHHLTGHPQITCQSLILERLPPNMSSWREIAQKYNISISTLTSFYSRRCLSCLRKFAHSQSLFEEG